MTDPSGTAKEMNDSSADASNMNPSEDGNAKTSTELESDKAPAQQDDKTNDPAKPVVNHAKTVSIHTETNKESTTAPKPHPNSTMPFATNDKHDTLHTISFNQDGGCLAVGTASGFRICNVMPFCETFRRELMEGQCEGGECVPLIVDDINWLFLFKQCLMRIIL